MAAQVGDVIKGWIG